MSLSSCSSRCWGDATPLKGFSFKSNTMLKLPPHYIWQLLCTRGLVFWIIITIWENVAICYFIHSPYKRVLQTFCKYDDGFDPDYCSCAGLLKVLHELPEPAAPQHEPHGQQTLQLRCLWQKLLPGGHPEETPAYPHIDAASTQAWTQTGKIPLKFKGSIKTLCIYNFERLKLIIQHLLCWDDSESYPLFCYFLSHF